MNKKFLIAGLSVLVIVLVIALLVWNKISLNNSSKPTVVSNENVDPFAGLTLPPSVANDPDTKAIVNSKIDLVKKMYAEKPDDWQTWIAIGNIRALVEDYNGAIAGYQNALALTKNNVLSYRNIAAVYANNLHDYPKAAENYKLAIKNAPGDIENYLELALIQEKRLNSPLDAEQTLKDGLSITNNNPDIWLALIRFYESTGDMNNYKLQAKEILKAFPENKQYQALFGSIIK